MGTIRDDGRSLLTRSPLAPVRATLSRVTHRSRVSGCGRRRDSAALREFDSLQQEGYFNYPQTHHPSLILAWEGGGVRASANIFKAIFGTSMGYMLRGSKNGLVGRERSSKPF